MTPPEPISATRSRVRLWTAAVAASVLCGFAVLGVGLVKGQSAPPPQSSLVGVKTADAPAGYMGSSSCGECHAAPSAAWNASQHARAMQAATPATVLGDFNEARVAHFKSQARFFKDGEQFKVELEGKDGKPASFVIDSVFGIEPLQQLLTTFPDGRVQALPYAWDTRAKDNGGQRWFHLYPDEAIPHTDALHWTGGQQNWNFMCADCHSTAVRKAYDPATNRYATRYSEISVGCESCHGPAASHVGWARDGRSASVANKGFASVAAKRQQPDWTPDPKTGSPAAGVSRPVGDEVETCGTCHARLGQFAEGWTPGKPLADFYRPAFLMPDLFEDDGQMKDEVFNYTSFQQSKMHAKGVVCSDCHDAHSAKLKASGAEICSQCHLPQKFTDVSHTGHPPGASPPASAETAKRQPDCVSCHMPVRTYMVVDPRHDHSFRVPRPDLSVSLGTPNTCNDCHRDKPASWAAGAVERWHGPTRKGAQTFAAAFHAARTDAPEARDRLLAVVEDRATPAIARASALVFLQGRPAAQVDLAMAASLVDPDPMVRIAALGGLSGLPPDQRWRRASPLLADPVRAVRLQAATTLAEGPPTDASASDRQAFASAAAEYIAAERFNADRPENRSNLGRFLLRQGRPQEAEQEYLAALRLGFSIAPRVDLADLYRATGREADAELLLRQTIVIDPQAAAPRHALGLALVRARKHEEALEHLRRAAELDPAQTRYAYVYAVALDSIGRSAEASRVLTAALQRSPSSVPILSMLLQGAMKAGDPRRALAIAERLRIVLPDDASLAPLISQLRSIR